MENQEIYTFVAAAVISYLSGSVPYGYLIGKMKGIDIRQHGSCNIGATNVTRVLGKGWGRLCFACDFLKGWLPVFLLSLFFCKDAVTLKYLPVLCALFAVLGHIFPVWLKFKGGKGIAVAAGAIFALAPLTLVCGLIVWAVTFFVSRYVSLASILAAGSMPVFAILFTLLHITRASLPEVLLFFLLALLTIVKHSSNIRRLRQGTESRFEKKEKSE